MKKMMMMIAMMAMPFAMQAQKYHDALAFDAKGPVKSITVSMMGNSQTTNFTQEGKLESSEQLSDIVYDDNGYIKKAKMNMMGQSIDVTFLWENDVLKGQTMSVMGQEMKSIRNYDSNGMVTSDTVDMGGQTMETPYSDYKFDEKGNWISRKASMMGNEMEFTRTIVYY